MTPPAAPHLPTPPSLTPPGSQTGTSDVAMGAGTAGGAGYGRTYTPPPSPLSYINSVPGVMAAQSAYISGAGQANTNYRNQLNDLTTWFGDPTAFATGQQPGSVSSGLTSENGNNVSAAAPYQSMAQALGVNVDPAVAALARANTVGPGGAVGNSIVAQLHLAAANARSAAIAAGSSSGGAASGSLGVNVNNANLQAGQNMFNAVKAFQAQTEQMSEGRLSTIDQLRQAVIAAITKAPSTIAQNPGLYPVQTQGAFSNVGGTRGLAADQPLNGSAGYNPAAYVPGGTAPWIARRMQAQGYAS